MTITALPTPPSRSAPSTFSDLADAFIAALPTFVTEANAQAALLSLEDTTATSVTSVAIGTGSKSLTVDASKSYQPGMSVKIARTSSPSNWMHGDVTSYNSSTGALVVNATLTLGSGTFTDWTVTFSAPLYSLASPTFTGVVTAPTIDLTGGQIAFPATAVPSSDPNTIDDYEEGYSVTTVVGSTSGSFTLDSANDTLAYTKTGRLVHLQGYLSITGESSPVGTLQISLPFAAAALTEGARIAHSPTVLYNHGDAGMENPIAYFPTGGAAAAYVWVYNITDNGTLETIDQTRVDTAFAIAVNFSYIAE